MIKYTHGGDIYKYDREILDFSVNINPLGMPKAAKDAIISSIEEYETYPDFSSRKLRKSLGDFYNIDPNLIVCGNGAADLIFRICIAMKPKNVLVTAPTFSEYEEAASLVGSKIKYHYLSEDDNFKVKENILEMIDNHINMVFLCSPNNPTGQPVNLSIIIKILKKLKALGNGCLILDHCFLHFITEEDRYSAIRLLEEWDNLIIVNAFTKIYAMAGIRLGYGFFPNRKIADMVQNTLQPWAVSTVAAKAGEAAIDKEFIQETKKVIKREREFLQENLNNIGFKVYPSETNYIMVKGPYNLYEKLEPCGILIRCCGNFNGLDDSYYRVAVKSRKDNEKLIEILQKVI
ncbi:pyridoxal phosphate-dependent aminotransferase [Eubacteriales bacterium KG127]